MIYDWHEHVVVCYIDFADNSIHTIKTLISNESLQQLVTVLVECVLVHVCVFGSCFFSSK